MRGRLTTIINSTKHFKDFNDLKNLFNYASSLCNDSAPAVLRRIWQTSSEPQHGAPWKRRLAYATPIILSGLAALVSAREHTLAPLGLHLSADTAVAIVLVAMFLAAATEKLVENADVEGAFLPEAVKAATQGSGDFTSALTAFKTRVN